MSDIDDIGKKLCESMARDVSENKFIAAARMISEQWESSELLTLPKYRTVEVSDHNGNKRTFKVRADQTQAHDWKEVLKQLGEK